MAGQKYLNPLLHCCIALYWVSTSVDIKHSGWSGNNYSETAGMWHQGVGGTVILVIFVIIIIVIIIMLMFVIYDCITSKRAFQAGTHETNMRQTSMICT